MQVEKFLNDRCRNVHIGMLAFLLCFWLLTSNQDGKGGVMVANGGWMNVSVYLQSRGKLLPYELYRIPYASHYNPDGMKVADINSDGANDIVIADYNHGLVVLYNNN